MALSDLKFDLRKAAVVAGEVEEGVLHSVHLVAAGHKHDMVAVAHLSRKEMMGSNHLEGRWSTTKTGSRKKRMATAIHDAFCHSQMEILMAIQIHSCGFCESLCYLLVVKEDPCLLAILARMVSRFLFQEE